MNFLQRMEQWGNSHHPKWLDFLRIALGIYLIFKGIQFLNNMGMMMNLMESRLSFNSLSLVILGHYIIFAHLLGGFLLVLGLLTRFACLVQIPILLGAVIFINSSWDMMRPLSELWISILVLLLLVYFLIIGNGPFSFNRFVESDRIGRAD